MVVYDCIKTVQGGRAPEEARPGSIWTREGEKFCEFFTRGMPLPASGRRCGPESGPRVAAHSGQDCRQEGRSACGHGRGAMRVAGDPRGEVEQGARTVPLAVGGRIPPSLCLKNPAVCRGWVLGIARASASYVRVGEADGNRSRHGAPVRRLSERPSGSFLRIAEAWYLGGFG